MAEPKQPKKLAVLRGGLNIAKRLLDDTDSARRAELMSHSGDKTLPLVLPRARMTPEFIDQQADRVARQMLGEHVRSGRPKDTANLAGRSMKESQRLKELDYKLTPTGTVAQETPYIPRKGDVKVAFPGDQTVSNKVLNEVEGFPIDSVQEGGAYYGLGQKHLLEPEFWKSTEGPAKNVQSKVDRVAELFEPERVIGSHLAMGPTANNFAMHFADANLRAVDWSKVQPDNVNVFDNIIANGYKDPKTGEMVTFPNWPGIADREAALAAMKEDSNLRKWFNNRMKVPDLTQPLGLPNGLDIQYAITEPRIRDMEINMTGLMTGELKPGALVEAAGNPHNTYSHRILGEAQGPQEVLTPFVIGFPDAAQHIATTKRPSSFSSTIQKVFPHQLVDDQYLDEYNRYRERIKKLTGQKKGGEVDTPSLEERLTKAIANDMASGGKVDSMESRLTNAISQHMAGGGGAFKKLEFTEDNSPVQVGLHANKQGENDNAGVMANLDMKGAGRLNVGYNLSGRNGQVQPSTMVNYSNNVDDLGFNANVIKPTDAPNDFMMTNLMASYPVGRGRVSAGMHGNRMDGTHRVTGHSLGYNIELGGGNLNLNVMKPKEGKPMVGAQYVRSFDKGGKVGKLAKGVTNVGKKLLADAPVEQKIIQPPSIVIPSKVSNVKEAIRQSKGDFGARRVERAADEIPNLEKLYKEAALREAFGGDNAKALITMNPKSFERYAAPLDARFTDKHSTRHTPSGEVVSYQEYMEDYLPNVGAFNDVPFLQINKQEQGLPLLPFISGHEGRHRNRVLANKGEKSGLVILSPRSELREPFPRRSQDEYLQALRDELDITGNLVLPEKYQVPSDSLYNQDYQRPAIVLPDIYAEGGDVHMAGGGKLAKGLAKVGKKLLAERDVLPAAERDANLAKFLEGSKAPPTVYHATSKDFNQFSAKKLGQNTKHPTTKLGFFTAADPASTEDFITSTSGITKGMYEEGANVMPLHLSIKNPYEIPSTQYLLQSMALQNMKKKDADKFVQDFIDSAKAEGYDGLLIKANPKGLAKGNEFTSDNWVAFEPTQIKSSIGNRGTYDIEDPDITKAQGGLLHMAGGGKPGKVVSGLANIGKRLMDDAPLLAPKVKPPSDNVANVRQANFQYPKTIGNQTVAIDKLSGGVRMSDPNEVKRVKALADQIASPEGYISRIIVDHNNNVIEGQHRLEALRQLGITDVPVWKIEEMADTMPVDKMEAAVQAIGSIHPDHVGQLVSHALEHISEEGIDMARQMNYGRFQKHYNAALDAIPTENGMAEGGPAFKKLEFMADGGDVYNTDLDANNVVERKSKFVPYPRTFKENANEALEKFRILSNKGLNSTFPLRKMVGKASSALLDNWQERIIEENIGAYLGKHAQHQSELANFHIKNAIREKVGLNPIAPPETNIEDYVVLSPFPESKEKPMKKAEGGLAFKTLQWKEPQHFDGGGMAVDMSEGYSGGPIITKKEWETIKRQAPATYDWAKQNVKDELSQLKTPSGAKDFGLRVGASALGGIPDMINLGLYLTDLAAGTNLSSENPWFGSQQYLDAMEKAGMLGEHEFPIAETLAGFVTPAGLVKKGVKKGVQVYKGAKKTPENKRRGGLAAMSQ